MVDLPEALKDRIESALNQPVSSATRPDLGLTPALRYTLTLADGSKAFVKAAVNDDTEAWLRNEARTLAAIDAPFRPAIVAFIDEDADRPILITEDLSHGYWPASHEGVTWRDGDIDRVIATVREMSGITAPDTLHPVEVHADAGRWANLLADPEPIIALGICDATWLAQHGSKLAESEAQLDPGGSALVHGDVRSDNICLCDDRVVFVDWSSSGRGNPDHDLVELLPTLYLEEGPRPYDVMPDAAAWASSQAGYLTSRALSGKLFEGKDEPAPPWLVRVLTRLARINLEWAAECLRLPVPAP